MAVGGGGETQAPVPIKNQLIPDQFHTTPQVSCPMQKPPKESLPTPLNATVVTTRRVCRDPASGAVRTPPFENEGQRGQQTLLPAPNGRSSGRC